MPVGAVERTDGRDTCSCAEAISHRTSGGKRMRNRWSRLLVPALVAGTCAGCAGAIPTQAIPDYAHFSHSWEAPHVTLYWDCTEIEHGTLRLEGVTVNRWEPVPPRYLDLSVVGVDAQSRVLSRTQGAAEGVNLVKNFPVPFRLDLKEQGGEVQVDLAYRYQYRDDSLDRLSRWMFTDVTGRVPDACGKNREQPR